jgi:hypothetical protein
VIALYTCKYLNISVVSADFIEIFQHNQQYDTLLLITPFTQKIKAGIAYYDFMKFLSFIHSLIFRSPGSKSNNTATLSKVTSLSSPVRPSQSSQASTQSKGDSTTSSPATISVKRKVESSSSQSKRSKKDKEGVYTTNLYAHILKAHSHSMSESSM